MKSDAYFFHQTPVDLAKDLISQIPLEPTDCILEPFKGEGAFYNSFPPENPKLWAELEEGIDYTAIQDPYDWVITNPPFQLDTNGKRVNSFWYLLDYYTQRAKKGIAFLANDRCFCSLTPKRMKLLQERGWGITKLIVCSVKKWRGRYFFIMLEKKPSFFNYLLSNY